MQFAINDSLAWTVSHKPLYFLGADNQPQPVTERVAVVRDDNGAFLGTVSPQYETVQNTQLLSLINPMVEEGVLTIENMGFLSKGAKVFAQARIAQEYEIVGETYRGYITLLNGHTGNTSVAIGPSNIRVICGNTFAMAHQQIGEKFRHNAGVNERMLSSTAVLDYVNSAMATYGAYVEKLALAPCSGVQFRAALEEIYERPEKDLRRSFIDQLNGLFYSGAGNEGRTFYDAFNAVTDYNSNQSRKTAAGRFNYSNFGTGARIARRAMAVLDEMATV